MIGLLIGITIKFNNTLIENLGICLFTGILTIERIGLILVIVLFFISVINFIKEKKKEI